MSGVICPHCGQVHREGARFCATTGKLIPVTGPSGPQAAQHPAPAPPGPAPRSGPAQVGAPSGTVSPVGDLQAGLTGRLPPNSFLRERYLILRKIGQGGMAAVYQATDTARPGSQWAIKEMSDAALSASDRGYAVQSFLQEGNLLRQLNHPNLPGVIDVFSEGGKYYLVMEYVPGQTLQSMLEERTQPFTQAEVLLWALQLCDVLSYLHNQNPKIIFRDLKPSNIMLTPQGQIKLIDFGIVRFFKPGKTRDTMALGTPGYAAQEAIVGQTDERSDLYSLCVTLHQLLTLNDPARTMFHHPPVCQLNPAVSSELSRILERGLQNQREFRWASAAEMRAELARLGPRLGLPSMPGTAVFAPVQPGNLNRAASAAAQMPLNQPAAQAQRYPQPGGMYPSGYPPVTPPAVAGTMRSGAASPPPGVQGVGSTQRASLSTSRPTTRLLMVATQLTGRQLALLVAGFVVAIVLATLLLAEPLDQMGIDWNNVPVIAIFGALGYAAYPRRGTAFISQALLSTILVTTLWLRLGDQQGYSWGALALGALFSGAFAEIWVMFLPKLKGDRGDEAWSREAAWLAAMAVISAAIFMGLVTAGESGLKPMQWLVSAVLGVIGWFVGDMIKQYLLYRKTGLRKL
jgi:serine/threonine protein kinase